MTSFRESGAVALGGEGPAQARPFTSQQRRFVASGDLGHGRRVGAAKDTQRPPLPKRAGVMIMETETQQNESSFGVVRLLGQGSYRHEVDHGFCVICGSVWPCWRSARPTVA